MDISTLLPPRPPLDNSTAAQWLRALVARNPRPMWDDVQWRAALDEVRPVHVHADAQDLVAWMDANGLRHSQGHEHGLSLPGVSVGISKPGQRLDTEAAWEQARMLREHIAWLNAAPAQYAPMRVADVLLFGGMTKPDQATHGDLDGIILFQPKEEGASNKAAVAMSALGLEHVLRPQNSSLPSFRVAARNWLGDIQSFVSLDDGMKTAEVLTEHDPDFACWSLLGKEWTQTELEHTTADEDAWMLMAALQAGQAMPARDAYVRARVSALGTCQPCAQTIADRMLGRNDLEEDRKRWWQYLDRPGLSPGSRINPGALEQQTAQPAIRKTHP